MITKFSLEAIFADFDRRLTEEFSPAAMAEMKRKHDAAREAWLASNDARWAQVHDLYCGHGRGEACTCGIAPGAVSAGGGQ